MTALDTAMATIRQQVQTELDRPVRTAASLAAKDIADHHGATVASVIFYGSGLQAADTDSRILDFYVLADSCREANGGILLGVLNEILPPNVYYRELRVGDQTIRSKYALMSVNGFRKAVAQTRLNPSFWARFAQPCALVYSRDADAADQATEFIAQANITMVSKVAPTMTESFSTRTLWSKGFAMTYRAELRAENGEERGALIFDQYSERYAVLLEPCLVVSGLEFHVSEQSRYTLDLSPGAKYLSWIGWRMRIIQGKTLSLLRLFKGAFTFSGAIDYIAWKISRHSGVSIEIKPWQRRHPLIGGLSLFLKTRRRGGFR